MGQQTVNAAELGRMELCKIIDSIVKHLGMEIIERGGDGDGEISLEVKNYPSGSNT